MALPGELDETRGPGRLMFPVFGTAEDLVLGLVRPYFERLHAEGGPRVTVYTEYQDDMLTPAVLALNTRRTGIEAYSTNDDNWVRSVVLEVNTIASGIDAERDAGDLQEAVRHVLIDAHRRQVVIPNVGVINKVTSPVMATRHTDWASASGPVQYAKLPHDSSRYEGRYRLLVRPAESYDNKFLAPFDGRNH